MLDRVRLQARRRELSYVAGRFMTEHLIRVHALFEGDLTAALVLATVAQHNIQRYYDEVARGSTAGFDELVAAGAHVAHLRPCNALSVSAATGIPRETVRRKIQWLEARGWLTKGKRGELAVVVNLSEAFQQFDLEMIERLYECGRTVGRIAGSSVAAQTGPKDKTQYAK